MNPPHTYPDGVVCFYESDLTVFWIIAFLMLVAVVTYIIDCLRSWQIKRAIEAMEARAVRAFTDRLEQLDRDTQSKNIVQQHRAQDTHELLKKILAHLEKNK